MYVDFCFLVNHIHLLHIIRGKFKCCAYNFLIQQHIKVLRNLSFIITNKVDQSSFFDFTLIFEISLQKYEQQQQQVYFQVKWLLVYR